MEKISGVHGWPGKIIANGLKKQLIPPTGHTLVGGDCGGSGQSKRTKSKTGPIHAEHDFSNAGQQHIMTPNRPFSQSNRSDNGRIVRKKGGLMGRP
jgi:hypothetical protein